MAVLAIPMNSQFSELMTIGTPDKPETVRCINIVNFIRGVEPRFETDLLLPVQKQMEIILEHKLPATWLLQFDALVSGDFVQYLKGHMAPDHEVGFWFEMNQKLCVAADVEWRGRPGFEWDHLPPVAFTIGYTPEERIKLADVAMKEFEKVWGHHPKSIASWNLDSITMEHLSTTYGIDAYAVCRDQIATDGFTIWGAPIAGYYPSKLNCWSPAVSKANQIDTPVFRMLGQDPVHYYNRNYKKPDGRVASEPATMEPVWFSGRSEHFIKSFLDMISKEKSLKFAYAQLGQENSFPWPSQAVAYPVQMKALAALRDSSEVHVETMGESGRRFKKSFKTTPSQAQVILEDSFGNTDPAEASIWYQSRFYRANLHIRGVVPFFRDITVYSDQFEQPYLHKATRLNEVEQRQPAIVDGYHWSPNPGDTELIGAGGFLSINGTELRLSGRPTIRESKDTLEISLPLKGGKAVLIRFEIEGISLKSDAGSLLLSFTWDPKRSAFTNLDSNHAMFSWQGLKYEVQVKHGLSSATATGWNVLGSDGQIRLKLSQQP